jgi:hypothetical protein
MLKFIILLIFVTSLIIPIQSVDGLSCAEGYMIDPDYYDDVPTGSNIPNMGKCVPNPDYNPPPPLEQVPKSDAPTIEALLQALDTIDDLLDTIDELESSTSILDNPTILILLILVIVILAIIAIRRNFG